MLWCLIDFFEGFVDDELVKNLLKECVRMQTLDHPNVLKLSGVCLDGGPAPYIIMPFMANGSLLNYLQDNREYLVVDSSSENVVNFGGAWSMGGYWGRGVDRPVILLIRILSRPITA